MIRLVLRISVGMLLVLLASFLVVRWAALSTTRHHLERDFPRFLSSFDLARQRLRNVAPEELERELARVRPLVPHPLWLEDLDSPSIPSRARLRLQSGMFEARRALPRGWNVYCLVGSGTRVLVMGPLGPADVVQSFPLGLVSAALVGLVALGGFFLAWPLVQRVRGLERAARRISQGELGARAEVTSSDAVGRLGEQFNAMAARVQSLLESQRQLLQAVSHELRTPTARIRFGLEMLGQARTDEDRARRMASIEEDLTELDELVGELLLYLRCGDEAAPLAIESFDARVELEELLERLGESRSEIRVQLEAGETASGESSSVAAERRYFRRAMQNLISNALKYARSEVSLRVEGSPEVTLIAVEDDGPGVPEDQRQRIFEPFARVDDSRSRESGGVGLGLAIVKRIVELHQGSVRVESSEHGGARFVVGWPRRSLASTRGDT